MQLEPGQPACSDATRCRLQLLPSGGNLVASMARIRTIKPEFWTSEQIVECSPLARLLFIGMWNFADDAGRLHNSPKQLKMRIFPGDDDVTSDTIHGMVSELSRNALIAVYAVDNNEYIQVTGWKHQVINRPQPSKIPPPSTGTPIGHSLSDHGTITEDSRRKGMEGNGRERKGIESNNQQQHSTTPREPAAAAASSALPTIDTNQFEVLEQKLRAAAGYEQAPYPNLFNVGPILKLTQDGFDLETDILPVIRAKAKTASRPVQSWAFFVPAILEAKQASGKFNGGPFPVAQSAKSKQEQRAEMFAHHRANAKADGCDPDTELGLRRLLMAVARGEWKATWGSDPIGKNGRTERSDIMIPAEWLASHLAVLENCAALLWKGGCYNDVEQLARFMGTKAIPAKTADELPNPEMARLCDEYLKIDPLEPPRLSPSTKPSLMPAIPSTFAQDGVSHLQ